MKRKITITILLFFGLICLPYVIWPFIKGHVDTENHENRTLSESPLQGAETLGKLTETTENFVNDHLPFRNQLIKLNGVVNYSIFKTSTSEDVSIGKDGWLFFTAKGDGDPLGYYRGEYLLPEEQLQQMADNLVTARALLQQFGIEMTAYNDPSVTITEEEDEPGDLVTMLNMYGVIPPGKTYGIDGYSSAKVTKEEWDFGTYFRYSAENADPRKIMFLRDSFGSAMSDIVGSEFASTVMVHREIFTNEMIREEKPDIFVLEAVERKTPDLLMNFVYE